MADFMTNLWTAVFEAGPTPTLILATNATFAALQVVFLALLIATYSIHFVILSVLCAGLWYSINWFAVELRAAQEKQEDASGLQEQDNDEHQSSNAAEVNSAIVHADLNADAASGQAGIHELPPVRSTQEPSTTVSGAQLRGNSAARLRHTHEHIDNNGDVSTDSEWEQIDEER